MAAFDVLWVAADGACLARKVPMEASPSVPQRCSGCAAPIREGDIVLRQDGAWAHPRCAWPIDGSAEKVAVVICTICHAGIARISELRMSDEGPTHVNCGHNDNAHLDGSAR